MFKARKIFKKMNKAHDKGRVVTYVSNFENVREVAKMLISLPETIIENMYLESPEWDGYEGMFLLSYDTDSTVWIQKAYLENGAIAKGTGTYIISNRAIISNKPEDYVLGDEQNKIIIVNDIAKEC